MKKRTATESELMSCLYHLTGKNNVISVSDGSEIRYRWVTSTQLQLYLCNEMGLDYNSRRTRRAYNRLAEKGIIDRDVSPGEHNSYSLKEYEGAYPIMHFFRKQ